MFRVSHKDSGKPQYFRLKMLCLFRILPVKQTIWASVFPRPQIRSCSFAKRLVLGSMDISNRWSSVGASTPSLATAASKNDRGTEDYTLFTGVSCANHIHFIHLATLSFSILVQTWETGDLERLGVESPFDHPLVSI